MQYLQRKAFSADGSIRGMPTRHHRGSRPVQCLAQLRKGDVALSLATTAALLAPAASAAEQVSTVAGLDGSLTFAAGTGAAVVGLAALLVATDPQKRCALRVERCDAPRCARGIRR